MGVLAELPSDYQALAPDAIERRTLAAKKTLGDSLCLLVHNYQRDEIARFADAMGDSFQLSVFAKKSRAKHIVFAGVTFMAETADLVTDGERNVVMPSMEASCPMAGMSEMVQVAKAWDKLADNPPPNPNRLTAPLPREARHSPALRGFAMSPRR